MQQGQVFALNKRAANGGVVWAYRYRTGGPGSRRLQRGGFVSERDAAEALERALERLRRQSGVGSTVTLRQLVDEYLAQHEAEPETLAKLRWLLGKALAVFGERRLSELRSQEIAAWRMTIPSGHRFEATQALRQVLARGVVWGMIDFNVAKRGVENRQPPRTEKRPFESWAQRELLAARLGPRYGPMVMFAAATGLRPGDWMALEHGDLDREARVLYVRRALRNGRIKATKTDGSMRAVPLQAIALAALDELPRDRKSELLIPSPRGGYFDLHNFRNRHWKPAQLDADIRPRRRVYDLRHTFATFALRAGISTFDLSRYMGASLTMIDRHYGHLARDGREHAIRLLDSYTQSELADVQPRDARWTSDQSDAASRDNNIIP
jgi:integrase